MVVPAASLSPPFSTTESSVSEVFRKFNGQEPGSLQFWAWSSTPSTSEDIGCYLTLSKVTYMITPDQEGLLQDYRKRCLEKCNHFVGLETMVGNWLAGRAAQTRIADHRTIDHVVNQVDRDFPDVGGMGQLVLPVFDDQGAGMKFVGIIEYVTPVPKESYAEDFEQIHNLLRGERLNSTCMGKTIKVAYDGCLVKFTLPLSAKLRDLHEEVKMRFLELKNQKGWCLKYEDTEGNRFPISSDEDLEGCMAKSSLKGAQVIRMCVMLAHTAV